MICIFLFDTTGVMAEPWAGAGYECHCFDLQNDGRTENGIQYHYWDADNQGIPYRENVAFVAMWPPCTDLSISGARWFKGKGLHALSRAIRRFAICADYGESVDAPYLIENPMSTISTYWRKPDHKFHPCHYNLLAPQDSYTKETWLWVGGGFVMPPGQMDPDLFIDTDYIHHQPPGAERANIRSATPAGFALAAYQANHK